MILPALACDILVESVFSKAACSEPFAGWGNRLLLLFGADLSSLLVVGRGLGITVKLAQSIG
jgi:hypothetical protein